MKYKKQINNWVGSMAAAFMVITLLWLTISTPFVYAADQQQDAYAQANNTPEDQPDSEDSPLGSNTTEEKAETGVNTLSEYLHDINELSQPASSVQQHNCSHDVAVYVAFHGEMLCPPPNSFLS